jgi:hypothetical protein
MRILVAGSHYLPSFLHTQSLRLIFVYPCSADVTWLNHPLLKVCIVIVPGILYWIFKVVTLPLAVTKAPIESNVMTSLKPPLTPFVDILDAPRAWKKGIALPISMLIMKMVMVAGLT